MRLDGLWCEKPILDSNLIKGWSEFEDRYSTFLKTSMSSIPRSSLTQAT